DLGRPWPGLMTFGWDTPAVRQQALPLLTPTWTAGFLATGGPEVWRQALLVVKSSATHCCPTTVWRPESGTAFATLASRETQSASRGRLCWRGAYRGGARVDQAQPLCAQPNARRGIHRAPRKAVPDSCPLRSPLGKTQRSAAFTEQL